MYWMLMMSKDEELEGVGWSVQSECVWLNAASNSISVMKGEPEVMLVCETHMHWYGEKQTKNQCESGIQTQDSNSRSDEFGTVNEAPSKIVSMCWENPSLTDV